MSHLHLHIENILSRAGGLGSPTNHPGLQAATTLEAKVVKVVKGSLGCHELFEWQP